MLRLSRKFVAVLLAVWLPLFSGNALAASIGMQTKSGDCDAMQSSSLPSQHDSAHQHMHHHQLAANHEQQDNPQHRQDSSCNNCGVCHLACSGYLAAVTINVADAQPAAQSFTLSATQFQSFTSAPLDPPPLALA
jgi:hypothetical protein